jgi:hypothetical protein
MFHGEREGGGEIRPAGLRSDRSWPAGQDKSSRSEKRRRPSLKARRAKKNQATPVAEGKFAYPHKTRNEVRIQLPEAP